MGLMVSECRGVKRGLCSKWGGSLYGFGTLCKVRFDSILSPFQT